ncbi:sulfonate ABC transporter substrate-binding protein [Sphaerospermopsis kisseleviana CS-549]|jgi:sulfonate transport system substrate-binding protein|uniref:Sulfonate ABC transporter substrate-binding protein n=1 Tax=Sphaerospermopsis kisseleviana CS-549 TaxID=3021783 RepID=A0ABT4ZKU8_9CYAN|nr:MULTISPECIES: sulfonate ABC transporter substrate-binding protein [Sphaerospermopsis]MBC5795631.1 sulfonate ABC transporter substrate-binding protein [Sphaerospermopsis sp. LEGE 00249]MDB9440012.1 sulfonate ABC transporter substrate-binding protein [Sphaerospermopsis kisseleviana CS-549]BAZ83559.1 aliphatic sulfonates ABC transporter substrate-binding protein [Sphaerospermopsis kisseleviana NIES-73]
MKLNLPRRIFLQKFLQYSISALALVTLSVPISSKIVEAQNTTNKTGINTKVVRLAYQTSGDIVKIKGVVDKRLEPLGIKVEWSPFPAGPQLMEAMNANRVDIGSVGETPPIFAQAAGAQLAYIAGRKPSKGEGSAIVVQQNSPIKTVKDLKGKKVVFQKGSAAHYLLLRALGEVGLKISDIQAVSLTPAEARDAFIQKKIDAWVAWDPFIAFVQKNANARVLRNASGIANQGGFYMARRSFAVENPEVVRIVLEEVDKLGEWAESNPNEVVKILAPELKLDPALLSVVVRRRTFRLRPINSSLIAEQQRIADLFYNEKVIPRRIAIKDSVLTSQQYAAITPRRISRK